MDQYKLEDLFKGEEGRHFNELKLEEVREFLIRSLSQYSSAEKLTEANKVTDVMVGMLKKKKQISDNGTQAFIEILIAAALVHNMFYDGTIPSLFEAREKLAPIADEVKLPENGRDAIFQAIEAQLGDDMPVSTCRPIPSTPTELFAWAVWFVKEYNA